MRFKFLGTACGTKLYGDTIGRYSFLISNTGEVFSATYKDLMYSDQIMTYYIGEYPSINEAKEACSGKLKELVS